MENKEVEELKKELEEIKNNQKETQKVSKSGWAFLGLVIAIIGFGIALLSATGGCYGGF